MKRIEIINLNDNRNDNCDLDNEHGLSLYIRIDEYAFLFDTGQSDVYINNAKKLNVDLDKIDTIVLSHGHYDHANGLKFFDKKVNLITHPDCFNYRVSKRTGTYGGMNLNKDEIVEKFNLITSVEPYKVVDDVYYLGQVKRTIEWEGKKFPMVIKDGTDDIVLDDSGLLIKTSKGLIIISGCAHSGICNTIEYAKEVTKENKVLAVMGGFHLKEINDATMKTLGYIKNNDIESIYLSHCTDDIVCDYFRDNLSIKVNVMKVGERYTFE